MLVFDKKVLKCRFTYFTYVYRILMIKNIFIGNHGFISSAAVTVVIVILFFHLLHLFSILLPSKPCLNFRRGIFLLSFLIKITISIFTCLCITTHCSHFTFLYLRLIKFNFKFNILKNLIF